MAANEELFLEILLVYLWSNVEQQKFLEKLWLEPETSIALTTILENDAK